MKNKNNVDPIPSTSYQQDDSNYDTQPPHPQKKRQLIILSDDDDEDEVSQVQPVVKRNTKRQKQSAGESEVQMVAKAIMKSVEKNDELVRTLVQSSNIRTPIIFGPNTSSISSEGTILNNENPESSASNSVPFFENRANIPPETTELISKFADFVAEKARDLVMKCWDDFLNTN